MMRKIKDYMTDDHNRLSGIFNLFRDIKRKDHHKAKDLFHIFKTGLQRRMVWEEEILFPALERKEGTNHRNKADDLRAEHQKIHELIKLIHDRIVSNDMTTDMLEKEFIETLSTHINKEETVFYSSIDHLISEKERIEIYLKMKSVPHEKYEKMLLI